MGVGRLFMLCRYGYSVRIASSARAMDAYGHRTYWFLGFIPIANLALFFKRPRERKRLGFQRLAGNALLIVFGVLLVGTVEIQGEVSKIVIGALARGEQFDDSSRRYLKQDESQKRVVAAFLKDKLSKIPHPRSWDDSEVFVSTEIIDATIRYTFEHASALPAAGSSARKILEAHEVCRDPELSFYMEMGAFVERRHVTPEGTLLNSLIFDAPACPMLRPFIEHMMQKSTDFMKIGVPIDDETVSTGGGYEGDLFTVYLKYTGDRNRLSGEYIRKKLCDHLSIELILTLDFRIRGVYQSDQGVDLADADVDYAMCQSLRKK